MSHRPPEHRPSSLPRDVGRWRPASGRLMATGAGALLLAACGGDVPTATGPTPSLGTRLAAGAAAGTFSARDSLSRLLGNTPGTCLVGTRTADGRYPARTVTVQWPARFASIEGRTARVGYRGWQAGLPEPAIIAACTIADVPGAREFLSGHLGGTAMDAKGLKSFAKSAGVSKTEQWGVGVSPHVMATAGPIFMIDGLASRFPTVRGARFSVASVLGGLGDAAVMMVCDDPSAPGCDGPADPPPPPPPPPTCDPYVDLPQPGCEETPSPVGTPPAMPDVSPVPASAVIIECKGQTQWAHLSHTVGFEHNVNVHATTRCNRPTRLNVTVTLHRERCFLWFICGWPQVGNAGQDPHAFASDADAHSDAECVWDGGLFKGKAWHTATLSDGEGWAETEGPEQWIDCLLLPPVGW
jgi:hypothetical protein